MVLRTTQMYLFLVMAFLCFNNGTLTAEGSYVTGRGNTQTKSAVLYHHPQCSHCHEVMSYLSSVHKTLTMKNITNPQYKQELRSYGQQGVPALVVGSDVIVGSGSIISYFRTHPEVLR